MTSLKEHVYLATRAQIARAAARSANDVSARFGQDKPASANDGDPAVRRPALPLTFPLRSIAKWTPVES